MGEGSDQIAVEIEQTRNELGFHLQELEHKIKDAADWKIRFREHPFAFLAAAFGGGLLLSRLVVGSTASPESDPD